MSDDCPSCNSSRGSHMSDCPALAKAFRQVEVHPDWARNPFHDKPEVGLADILVELQSIRDMQDSRAADILEAVRALKPERPALSLHDPDFYERLRERMKPDPALDTAEAHIELQKSAVARGYQPGDGAILASLYAANKRQLADIVRLRAENERLQAKVADQALTVATLKDNCGRLRSLLDDYETHKMVAEVLALRAVAENDKRELEILRAELAQTKHLLSEERALTAATVGQVPTPLSQEQSG